MFEVGALLKGKENNGYASANEDMKKAEVIYARGYPVTMGIRILEHANSSCIGKWMEVENRESYFELL